MGVMINVTGHGSIGGNLTDNKLSKLRGVLNAWGHPAFNISEDGSDFEFTGGGIEGCDPYTDGVLNPLKNLIEMAKEDDLTIDGEFTIKSDWSDYDNIVVMVTDNELSTANSELVHASTDELVDELKRRNQLQKTRDFDIVLLEKPGNNGLNIKEVISLYRLMPKGEALAYPFEIVGESSSAEGFITEYAAEELDFEYDKDSGLGVFISSILNDMEKESADGTYEFEGLRIWMRRDV